MELEFAKFLRDRNINAKRGQQFKGGENSPDIIHELKDIHLEVKSAERFNYVGPLKQAIEDGGSHQTPVVIHRYKKTNKKDSYPRGEWVAILKAEDLFALLKETSHYRCEDKAGN